MLTHKNAESKKVDIAFNLEGVGVEGQFNLTFTPTPSSFHFVDEHVSECSFEMPLSIFSTENSLPLSFLHDDRDENVLNSVRCRQTGVHHC